MLLNLTAGLDLIDSWEADIQKDEPPFRFSRAEPFAGLDLRPERMILIGGAPGHGKTAASVQIAVDLLRLNESARVLIANVEMKPQLLLDRAASRLSNVPLSAIVDRTMTPNQKEHVHVAVKALELVAARIAFLGEPYSLEHVSAAIEDFRPNVLILDYIQRFTVGDGSGQGRELLEYAATMLRRFCDGGMCVLAISAVARQKGATGSTYSGLGLASFRGSSELEFGTDAAYLLARSDKDDRITFKCAKNRHGSEVDIVTHFDATVQTFSALPSRRSVSQSNQSAKLTGRTPRNLRTQGGQS